jgi:hypothetical protein
LVYRIACLFDMRPSLACDAMPSTSRVISTKCTMWHSTRSRRWPSTKRGLSTPHMWKARRGVQCSCLSATRRFGVGDPRSARDGSNPDVGEALRIGSSGSRFGDAARAERCRARADFGPLGDDSSCRSVSERLSAGAPLVGAVWREVSKARGVGALTPGPASVGPGVRNRRPDRDQTRRATDSGSSHVSAWWFHRFAGEACGPSFGSLLVSTRRRTTFRTGHIALSCPGGPGSPW